MSVSSIIIVFFIIYGCSFFIIVSIGSYYYLKKDEIYVKNKLKEGEYGISNRPYIDMEKYRKYRPDMTRAIIKAKDKNVFDGSDDRLLAATLSLLSEFDINDKYNSLGLRSDEERVPSNIPHPWQKDVEFDAWLIQK